MNKFKDYFARLLIQVFTAYRAQQPPLFRESSPSVWKRLLSGDQIRPSSQWNNGSRRVVKFICRTRSDPASVKGKDAAGVRIPGLRVILGRDLRCGQSPRNPGQCYSRRTYRLVNGGSELILLPFYAVASSVKSKGLTVPHNKRILHLCTIPYWNESVTSVVVIYIIQGLDSYAFFSTLLISPPSMHRRIICISLHDSVI